MSTGLKASLFALGLMFLSACTAAQSELPLLSVGDAWARPTTAGEEDGAHGSHQQGSGSPGPALTTAVYLTLRNDGGAADRLIDGHTALAERVEIHETVHEGEVARMQRVKEGILVPADGQVELEPGGYHIMLIGLQKHLKPGDDFDLELIFERSGSIQTSVLVRSP